MFLQASNLAMSAVSLLPVRDSFALALTNFRLW